MYSCVQIGMGGLGDAQAVIILSVVNGLWFVVQLLLHSMINELSLLPLTLPLQDTNAVYIHEHTERKKKYYLHHILHIYFILCITLLFISINTLYFYKSLVCLWNWTALTLCTLLVKVRGRFMCWHSIN